MQKICLWNALLGSILIFSVNAKAQEMKKSEVDTIFEQGEANPYGEFFTGQTYLRRLSEKDDVFALLLFLFRKQRPLGQRLGAV